MPRRSALAMRNSKKSFQCDVCHALCKSKNDLMQHSSLHQKLPFECEICNVSFAKKPLLTKHMMAHGDQKPFVCDQCERSFRSKDGLARHVTVHMGKKRKSCFGAINVSKVEPKNDDGTSDSEEVYQCDVCSDTFEGKAQLAVHMATHSETARKSPKALQCSMCEKSFATKAALESHCKMHRAASRKSCSAVNIAWSDVKQIKNYGQGQSRAEESSPTALLQTKKGAGHMTVEKFTCSRCDSDFMSQKQLVQHMEEHVRQDSSTCSICDVTFAFHNQLTKHMLEHELAERDAEQESSSVIPQKKNVPSKFTTELEAEYFECNVCQCGFVKELHLMKHMREHADSHPFSCKECHGAFSRKAQLTKHMPKHANKMSTGNISQMSFSHPNTTQPKSVVGLVSDELHECTICKKSFAWRSQLLKHMMEHEKQLMCDMCGSTFLFESELSEHMQQHLQPKFECGICHKRFEEKMELIEHTLSHADEDSIEVSKPPAPRKAFTFEATYSDASSSQSTVLSETTPQRSIRMSLSKKLLACEVCGENFKSKSALSKHAKLHEKEEEEEEEFAFSMSSTVSHLEDSEQENETVHEPRKQISPGKLAKTSPKISKARELLEIMEVDEDDSKNTVSEASAEVTAKPVKTLFGCGICHKSFKTKIALNAHNICHLGKVRSKGRSLKEPAGSSTLPAQKKQLQLGEGQFECNICHAAFESKGHRTKHVISMHSNKKAFQCDECSREFWSKDGLDRHVKTHTGKKRRR